MGLDAVFTLKLDQGLRDDFMAEAAAAHRPASQVARELMREYVENQRRAREYEAFLAEKVSAARASLQAGEGTDNAEVEARYATRRASAA